MDSSKMIGHLPEVLNFNRLLLKLTLFICNYIKCLYLVAPTI